MDSLSQQLSQFMNEQSHSRVTPYHEPNEPSLDAFDREVLASPSNYSQDVGQAGQRQRSRQGSVYESNIKLRISNNWNQADSQESNGSPTVQGIRVVPTHRLPDRFRSIFPFTHFNAVQSRCFEAVFHSDDNMVMSSPTGSGKTAIFELAICRLIAQRQTDQYKIVYQAPTKSLCSERQRDWAAKFASLNIKCGELTGDTDREHLASIQKSAIIITTPEKWDSVTRKWKDNRKLVEMIKLFLIDEVHILKDTRGATLEVVVSRMKSIGSNVRFIALSATLSNIGDIATWLGKSSSNYSQPACLETFGETFRPVQLKKFVYGFSSGGNEFALDKVCDSKLPDIISRHSEGKPLMIFCGTRKSAVATAKVLAQFWTQQSPKGRFWPSPSAILTVKDGALQDCITSGVAFHHAGLVVEDRTMVENAYLDGRISVICCTSTLAVGVNLPCHMVIIKNTVTWGGTGTREYADLEIMQMVGRAGRPQFGDSAVAIIMTRDQKKRLYEEMVSGNEIHEILESSLHLNLIEHLNAEIGLGAITDISSAMHWLSGTFLSVRMKKNPVYYNMSGDHAEESLKSICESSLRSLQEQGLIESGPSFRATPFGQAMAQQCIKFEAMKIILSLKEKAKVSEMLSTVTQSFEVSESGIKSVEKPLYREINKDMGIKFAIQVDIASIAHKASLLLQYELGGLDYPEAEAFKKHRNQFNTDKSVVFSHISRLIRCMIDCSVHKKDSVSVRNGLELARSFGAKVWDNSPWQLKQIPTIGPASVKRLVRAEIRCLEMLEQTEAAKINMILSKNAPFGQDILSRLRLMPKLRVSLGLLGKATRAGNTVKVSIKAEIGFLNEEVPVKWLGTPVNVYFLAETSDHSFIEFQKISARTISTGLEIRFTASLQNHDQSIACHVMCDDIAGSMRSADLQLGLSPSMFPIRQIQRQHQDNVLLEARQNDYGEDEIDDDSMNRAVLNTPIQNKEQFQNQLAPRTTEKGVSDKGNKHSLGKDSSTSLATNRLANGNFPCGHGCKDKSSCGHRCCQEGVRKQSKAAKQQLSIQSKKPAAENFSSPTKIQSRLTIGPGQRLGHESPIKNGKEVELVNLAGPDSATITPERPSNSKSGPMQPETRKRKYDYFYSDNEEDPDDEMTDLEASMVGLADSLALQEAASNMEIDNARGLEYEDDDVFRSTSSNRTRQNAKNSPGQASRTEAATPPRSSTQTPLFLHASSASSFSRPLYQRQALTPVSTDLPSKALRGFNLQTAFGTSPTAFKSGPRKKLRFQDEDEDDEMPLEELAQGRAKIIESNVASTAPQDPIGLDEEDIDPEILAEFADIVDFY